MRFVVLVVALTSPALAEVPFVSLDRASGVTSFGAHLGLMTFEDQDSDGGQPSLTMPRLMVNGEYAITPNAGVVASASAIRFSHVVEKTGLGPVHVGGYLRTSVRDVELVARAGLVLPTASFIPRDSYFEAVAVHGTLFPWLEERALDGDVFWIHGGGSARYRRAGFTAQLDALIDIPLGDLPDSVTRGTAMRVHLGGVGAYASGPWRTGVELLASGYMFASGRNVFSLVETEADVLFGLTLSAARSVGTGKDVVAWFSNPLDNYLRSRWHAFGFGYQGSL